MPIIHYPLSTVDWAVSGNGLELELPIVGAEDDYPEHDHDVGRVVIPRDNGAYRAIPHLEPYLSHPTRHDCIGRPVCELRAALDNVGIVGVEGVESIEYRVNRGVASSKVASNKSQRLSNIQHPTFLKHEVAT